MPIALPPMIIPPHCLKIKKSAEAIISILLVGTFLITSNLQAQSAEEINALNGRVETLLKNGQPAQALEPALKALRLSEDHLGPESPTTTDCLNNLAIAYEGLGENAKAEPLLLRGLAIREKTLGPEHPFTARILDNIGSLYIKMGLYPKAEPYLLRALTINEKVLGTDAPATITSVGFLGHLYNVMGDYSNAAPYLQRCVALSEKVFGTGDNRTAAALSNLAALYFKLGDFDSTESTMKRVLEINEKVKGPASSETARTLQGIATVYTSAGDLAKAESYYRRALTIQENRPEPDQPDLADTLSAFSMIYMRFGDYATAETFLKRALAIDEKFCGPEHPQTADVLSKLAAAYGGAGDFQKVEPLYQRVLQIQESRLGPNHPDVAATLLNLVAIYLKLKDFPKAENYGQRALDITEKAFGPENAADAKCLNDLAAVYLKAGNLSKAVPLFERSLKLDEKFLGLNNPDTLVQLDNLAFVYFGQQRITEALAMADRAKQTRLAVLSNILSFASEQQRLGYQLQDHPYDMFATLGSARQVALAILQFKCVILDSLLEDRLVAKASENPSTRALARELGPAKQRLSQMIMQPAHDLSEPALKERTERCARLADVIGQVEGALAEKVAGLGRARQALSVTVEQVQNAIPRNGVLIEFIRYVHYFGPGKSEYRYGATLLSPSGEPTWVSLGPVAPIDSDIQKIQQEVRQRPNAPALTAALRELYEKTWAPLQPFFPANTKTVIISPDASLNFVSFATLLTPGNHFLIENYSLGYVATGRDLLRQQKVATNQNIVIFGNPDFSRGGSAVVPDTNSALFPLPGTETESIALQKLAEQWNWPSQLYLGASATETQLHALHSPRILHLATHGFFLPEKMAGMNRNTYFVLNKDPDGVQSYVTLRNPMLRSVIALAGAGATLDRWTHGEVPPTETDGIVTAEEVGGLDLEKTWLVVLSACDTGIGQLTAGEGVMGLRRGFIQAGAQNLLMTLWPVIDKTTGEFMQDFYSAVQKGSNPPEALANVQRKWLVAVRNKFGIAPAVVVAGPFVLTVQGPIR